MGWPRAGDRPRPAVMDGPLRCKTQEPLVPPACSGANPILSAGRMLGLPSPHVQRGLPVCFGGGGGSDYPAVPRQDSAPLIPRGTAAHRPLLFFTVTLVLHPAVAAVALNRYGRWSRR
ncbi:hypothetical protein AAFF_G00294380 [Aldrovandia affinis]|uniref:Uncharacterized protein n=1 Tax=Aldrovandia affinis TaxID=143900 RepID=A0AAD7W1D8_9TELE|nr:hypothetical protein AAFF_G00294380 [Aldrovandia affinis]